MRRHRDFCRGQYSPIGQESKEELAGVYRLDTAGKGSKNTKKAEVRRQKSEVRSQIAEVKRTHQARLMLPSDFLLRTLTCISDFCIPTPTCILASAFLLLTSDF